MTDEPTAPEETQDTPGAVQADPDGGTPAQPTFDESQYVPVDRYKEAQAWGTKSSQTARAWEVLATSDDSDARQEAADFLGVELVDQQQPDDEYLDPQEELRKEIQELKTWREQQTRQAQEQSQMESEGVRIGEAVKNLQTEHGLELTDGELKAVYGLTVVLGAETGTDANADVQAAWELLNAVGKKGAERILQGKKTTRVSGGSEASAKPDLSTRKGRLAFAEERIAALEE